MDKLAAVAANVAADKVAEMLMSKPGKGSKKAAKKAEKEIVQRVERREKPKPKPKPKPQNKPVNTPRPLPSAVPVRFTHTIRQNKVSKVELTRYKGRDAMRMSGNDFWGVLTTGGNSNVAIYNMPINPLAVVNTRVAIEATLWTKFHYNSLTIEFVPNVGTGQNGALMGSHVTDPEMVLPANPGSLAYTSALMSSKGAVISPYYQSWKHTVRPEDNGKEYYIQPDVADEARLTVQGVAKIVQMTQDNPGAVGFIYVHYDLVFYDKVMGVNPTAMSQVPLTTGTAVANTTVKLADGGWSGVLTLSVVSGDTRFSFSTTYAVYFNFEFGGIEAMTIYYWKMASSTPGGGDLYLTPYDAQNGTTENRVHGSFGSFAYLPTNAVMYYQVATGVFNPTKDRHRLEIESLEDRLAMLETHLERATEHNNNNTPSAPRFVKRVY